MHEITAIQHNAIMAGLRLLQAQIEEDSVSDNIVDIATNAGIQPMPTPDEIDELCIAINTGPYKSD